MADVKLKDLLGVEETYSGVKTLRIPASDGDGVETFYWPEGTKVITGAGDTDVSAYQYARAALQEKNYAPELHMSGGTVTPDAGYAGISKITIGGIPQGTSGTPYATKGTPSGGSVSIVPSVINQTGYITGGVKNGTPVTVTAAELATGNKDITNLASTSVVGYSTARISETERNKLVAGNIRRGMTILGVAGDYGGEEKPDYLLRDGDTISHLYFNREYDLDSFLTGLTYDQTIQVEGITFSYCHLGVGFLEATDLTALGLPGEYAIVWIDLDNGLILAVYSTTVLAELGVTAAGWQMADYAPSSSFAVDYDSINEDFLEVMDFVAAQDPVAFGEYTEGTPISKSVTPDFSGGDMSVVAPAGEIWDEVDIAKPSTLIAENVRRGVTIAGVEGSFSGSSPTGTKNITTPGPVDVSTFEYAQAVLQQKTVTPSASSQTVTPDAGNVGLSQVTVEAIPAGTEGTPTATKGTPSGGSVTVTPGVTNAAGYISGGTKTGTPVTVSASELVSGTETITDTAQHDVTTKQYAQVYDINLEARNIKRGVNILGVTGSYDGSGVNLLDNWYFVGGGSQQGGDVFPINQRGAASYSNGYSIDRWIVSEYMTAALASGGVTISSGVSEGYFYQRLPLTMYAGKKLALTVLTGDGLFTASGTVPSSTPATTTSFLEGEAGDIRVLASATDGGMIEAGVAVSSGESVTVYAAKLELGESQSLAQQVNGSWVLTDPPPNFQQELAKCQRYQIVYAAGYFIPAIAHAYTTTSAYVVVTTPVQMRAAPAITGSNGSLSLLVSEYASAGGTSAFTSMTNRVVNANVFQFFGNVSGGLTAKNKYLVFNKGSGPVILDANL